MIREATFIDRPAIKKLMQSEEGFWQDSWHDDVIDHGIKSAYKLAFVWEESNQVVGFICAHDLGFRVYLSELIVDKSVRRKGIGKKLVRKIEDELTTKGRTVLISDVWRDAAGFYKNLGWSEPDVILMRKILRRK
ncbi:MAG: GNAT family N-acetyltransferase [Desulfobacterales bacterium]|nr:GNAT family N-acetyltransferase [Deltaproteobacteria bacterium]NNL76713.1 GNAT family N-acetyltransferase [Desulfobacterales bacterium]